MVLVSKQFSICQKKENVICFSYRTFPIAITFSIEVSICHDRNHCLLTKRSDLDIVVKSSK